MKIEKWNEKNVNFPNRLFHRTTKYDLIEKYEAAFPQTGNRWAYLGVATRDNQVTTIELNDVNTMVEGFSKD